MGLLEVKKELKKLDQPKLIELIGDLYKKNSSVKEFFDFYIQPNEEALFKKYHTKVLEAFYPKRGYQFRLKDGKQAISDFKKLDPSPALVADLQLFYVETGIRYTNDFGDIEESFYTSLENTYHAALTLMKKEKLLPKFADRAAKAVHDTSGIGWGFHDTLGEYFLEFYKKEVRSGY